MMKQIRILVILAMSVLVLACGNPTPDKAAVNKLNISLLSKDLTDSIYKYTNIFPNQTQVAIALIKNGTPHFYGIKRQADTLFTTRNGNNTFEIGSLTKVFTATILARYVMDGQIKLDDDINPLFPYKFHKDVRLSYKSLANHTSGLPRLPSNLMFSALLNSDDPYQDYDEKKLEKYLKEDLTLEFTPGSQSAYSNLGMGLLAVALQKQTGKDFESLLKETIFDKYGMTQSSTIKDNVLEHLIPGQNEYGKPTPNWSTGVLVGMGGIYSSVKDLSQFVLAQFDTTYHDLALTRVKTFQETKKRDVGLAWFILHKDNDQQLYWHNGGTGGYTSSMVVDVKNKNAVIILSNLSAYHPQFENIDKLAFALQKSL